MNRQKKSRRKASHPKPANSVLAQRKRLRKKAERDANPAVQFARKMARYDAERNKILNSGRPSMTKRRMLAKLEKELWS
jgi:hypothetical protein